MQSKFAEKTESKHDSGQEYQYTITNTSSLLKKGRLKRVIDK